MTLEDLIAPSKPADVWEKYVPVVTERNCTKAWLTDNIEAPSEYNELCYKLLAAPKGEDFYLYINNGGGYIDTAIMIIDAIKQSKARVIARLSGTVASAATVIALACDSVEVADHTAFMIHNYSGGVSGKGYLLALY